MTSPDTVFKLRGEQSYSQARRAGDMLFIAGTVSWDDQFTVISAGGFERQVGVVYGDIERTLRHFGRSLDAVVRETIYTCDMDALIAAHAVRHAAYGEARVPASTWIAIERLANAQLLLEIKAVASLA